MDQKKTIVMIGSSCIDEYYEMDHLPDLGDKAVLKFLENKVGGMIANAAAVAASYGMNTYLMDTMSGSDYTKMLEDDLMHDLFERRRTHRVGLTVGKERCCSG